MFLSYSTYAKYILNMPHYVIYIEFPQTRATFLDGIMCIRTDLFTYIVGDVMLAHVLQYQQYQQ